MALSLPGSATYIATQQPAWGADRGTVHGANARFLRCARREKRGNRVSNPLIYQYLPILVFLMIAAALSLVMVGASFILGKRNPDAEKNSPYECGFEPFEDARGKFDVRFYLVSILFIIFDLEVAFLFPWAVSLGDIGTFGFWSMMIFLAVLTVGFVYEWKKGALEWE
jgi:NADH-quinone oxidoreductase subunit A